MPPSVARIADGALKPAETRADSMQHRSVRAVSGFVLGEVPDLRRRSVQLHRPRLSALSLAVALRHGAAKKKGSRNSGSPGHKRSRKMPRDQRGREGGGGEESRDFSPNTGEILRPKACCYFTRLCFGCVSALGVLFKPLRNSANQLTQHRGLLGPGVGSFATSVPRAWYKREFLSRSLGPGAYTRLQAQGSRLFEPGRHVPRFGVRQKCDAVHGGVAC